MSNYPDDVRGTEPSRLAWKGREIGTVSDLVSALGALASSEDAQAFIAAYRKVEPHADVNAGYCIGYIGGSDAESVKRRAELHEWLRLGHPVFGKGGY